MLVNWNLLVSAVKLVSFERVTPEEVGHGPKRLMGNDLLITRAFSLTRWLSRSKHLLGKQDGRFWKSEGTKGQRYFIKIALKLKLLWSILRFLFGFLNFSVFKVQCAFFAFGTSMGFWIDEGLILFPKAKHFFEIWWSWISMYYPCKSKYNISRRFIFWKIHCILALICYFNRF